MNIASIARTAAPARTHTVARAAAAKADSGDRVELGNLDFHQVQGLPHIVAGHVQAARVKSPEQREALAHEMVGRLQHWPGAKEVITVVEGEKGKTEVVVASRKDAVEQPVLEGSYEIDQRFASSPFIKDMAHRYPTSYHAVTSFDPESKTDDIRLPGSLTTKQVEGALREGRVPDQYAMLKGLVDDLPKDQRVVLLVGGPSAAGKSTLIRKIQEYAGKRPVSVIEGDMYFKDADDTALPKTSAGTPYWDNPDAMDIDQMKKDLSTLLRTGEANIPVYNFSDSPPGSKRARAPQWRIQDHTTGFREDTPEHLTCKDNSIIVLDSIHATNPKVIKYFEDKGLTYRNVYLDSPSAEDRLLRRVVRDYAERGGRSVKESLNDWDQTTWPGEKQFIRPGLLGLDPARDLAMVLKFPNDLGLTRQQLETKAAELKQYGIGPTYQAFATPDDKLGELAHHGATA